MGKTLCTGNLDDYCIHDPGGPRVCGRRKADEGPEGRIESGPLFVQPTPGTSEIWRGRCNFIDYQ